MTSKCQKMKDILEQHTGMICMQNHSEESMKQESVYEQESRSISQDLESVKRNKEHRGVGCLLSWRGEIFWPHQRQRHCRSRAVKVGLPGCRLHFE